MNVTSRIWLLLSLCLALTGCEDEYEVRSVSGTNAMLDASIQTIFEASNT